MDGCVLPADMPDGWQLFTLSELARIAKSLTGAPYKGESKSELINRILKLLCNVPPTVLNYAVIAVSAAKFTQYEHHPHFYDVRTHTIRSMP